MKINGLLLLFACILLVGCHSEPKEFTYTFTMESADAYKLSLTIDQNKRYTLQEQYIFFDRRANQANPKLKEGSLSEEEFSEFKKQLSESKLFNMQDSYGFDKEEDQAIHDVLYHIIYKADGKEKFISIQLDDSNQFPLAFVKLIEWTNSFISQYKE